MTEHKVNSERVYYNFKGQFPPINTENTPAKVPPISSVTHPKLITDTTFRDGAQDPRFALFSSDAKLKYFDQLHALGNNTERIESVEVFIYQKRDLWVLEKLLERNYSFPQVTTWTRATPKDIKLMINVTQGAIKETGMLASASDHHIFDKLGFHSKNEAIEKYLKPITTAVENNIIPRIHLEDATRADINGWVIPFIERVLRETNGLARFRICDTIGYGLPDPMVSMPFGIPHLISTLVRETGAQLEFHGHNDFGLATANTIAALIYGCKRANTAFGGLGERTGNTPLEQIIANYIRIWGDPGFNLTALQEMSKTIDTEVFAVSPKQPIVGTGIFATQAGIHQTGLVKQRDSEGGFIYLPFDPAILNRSTSDLTLIGGLSGIDGIVEVLNNEVKKNTGKPGSYSPASKVVKYVYDTVQKSYDGNWAPDKGKYVNHRQGFFRNDEILKIAESYKKPTI